jgi:hypothetical protein
MVRSNTILQELLNKELHSLYSLSRHCKGDQIKDAQMRMACNMHGRVEKCIQHFE